MKTKKWVIREFVEECTLPNGRAVNVFGEGRLINVASAEGHPSSVMDIIFANQTLSAEFMLRNGRDLESDVCSVLGDSDKEIARLKLIAMGVKIDTLTPEQQKHLASWEMGT